MHNILRSKDLECVPAFSVGVCFEDSNIKTESKQQSMDA